MTDERDFLNWFAGFVDGEGSFVIVKRDTGAQYATRLEISLRDDDRPILIEILEKLKMGTIYRHKYPSAPHKPEARWRVDALKACMRLVQIFDEHPLRAKKQRDYLVWRDAVLENAKHPKARNLARMLYLADKIRLVRSYDTPEEEVIEPDAVQLSFPEELEE